MQNYRGSDWNTDKNSYIFIKKKKNQDFKINPLFLTTYV